MECVLSGGLRRTGEEVRLEACLVNVAAACRIWSKSYRTSLRRIFSVYQDIAAAIERITGSPCGAPPVPAGPDDSVEAYDLYLRAIYLENKRSAQDFHKALEYLRRAASLSPSFAPVYARLASSHVLRAIYNLESPRAAMTHAREAVDRALEIDPDLAQAHAAMACISGVYEWRWQTAGKQFRHALDLNSGVPEIHHAYAFFYLSPLGRHEEAIAHIRLARNLDPLSLVLSAAECAVLFWSGQYDEAIEQGRRTTELEQNYFPGYMYLSWAYRKKGLLCQAIEAAREAVRLSSSPIALCSLGLAHAAAGDRNAAAEVISRLDGLPYSPPALVAYIQAEMGDLDSAFASLADAERQRSPTLIYLQGGQWKQKMRRDERFSALVRAVRLPSSSPS